jgi:hypothetical protein
MNILPFKRPNPPVNVPLDTAPYVTSLHICKLLQVATGTTDSNEAITGRLFKRLTLQTIPHYPESSARWAIFKRFSTLYGGNAYYLKVKKKRGIVFFQKADFIRSIFSDVKGKELLALAYLGGTQLSVDHPVLNALKHLIHSETLKFNSEGQFAPVAYQSTYDLSEELSIDTMGEMMGALLQKNARYGKRYLQEWFEETGLPEDTTLTRQRFLLKLLPLAESLSKKHL